MRKTLGYLLLFMVIGSFAYGASVYRYLNTGGAALLIPSNITVSGITTSAATITWGTNFNSNTNRVKYGVTGSYGSIQNSSTGDGVQSHSASLAGLTANTLYHFSVCSTKIGDVEVCSSDSVFTVLSTTPNALVAEWLFNSTTADNTGNGNTLTLVNSPTYNSTAGESCRSAGLKGDGTNQAALIANQPVMDNLSVFSMCFTPYLESYGGSSAGRIYSKEASGSPAAMYIYTDGNNTALSIFLHNTAGSTFITTSAIDSLLLQRRTPICLTYDDAGDRKVHMYIDSTVETTYVSQPASTGTLQTNSNAPRILNRTDGNRALDGTIDDFRLYNYVISGATITTYMDLCTNDPAPVTTVKALAIVTRHVARDPENFKTACVGIQSRTDFSAIDINVKRDNGVAVYRDIFKTTAQGASTWTSADFNNGLLVDMAAATTAGCTEMTDKIAPVYLCTTATSAIKTINWFADFTVILNNFQVLGDALFDAGLTGVQLDTEAYSCGDLSMDYQAIEADFPNCDSNCDASPGNGCSNCQTAGTSVQIADCERACWEKQVRKRGKEIMENLLTGYGASNGFKFLYRQGLQQVRQSDLTGGTDITCPIDAGCAGGKKRNQRALTPAFVNGLLEGISGNARVVDYSPTVAAIRQGIINNAIFDAFWDTMKPGTGGWIRNNYMCNGSRTTFGCTALDDFRDEYDAHVKIGFMLYLDDPDAPAFNWWDGSGWYNGDANGACTVNQPKSACNVPINTALPAACIGNSIQCNGFKADAEGNWKRFFDRCKDAKYTTLEYCGMYDFKYYETDGTHAGTEPDVLTADGIPQAYLDLLNAAF